MARITKAPEERRLEIIETAERMFREIGYAKCSVEAIIHEIGVAKGTFYHYFRSKQEILGAIVDRTLDQIVDQAQRVADHPDLSALEKMEALLTGSQMGDEGTRDLADMMHLPENRELHELTNIQTVLRLSPVFAAIVDQGNREGVFDVAQPLEVMQFLLTGAQFLMDGGLFGFSDNELKARRRVTQEIVEKALGSTTGSFHFMTPGQEGA